MSSIGLLSGKSEVEKLEQLVFGAQDIFTPGTQKHDGDREATASDESDDEGPAELPIAGPPSNQRRKAQSVSEEQEKRPAWIDEDDEDPTNVQSASAGTRLHGVTEDSGELEKKTRLRIKRKLQQPTWADISSKRKFTDDSEEDEASSSLLTRTGQLIETTSQKLPKSSVQIKRVAALADNTGEAAHGSVNSVEFHRRSQVALVAGQAQRLLLFQIDGSNNKLLEGISFDRFPIDCAHFTADGERVLAGCRFHSYFYCYDMIAAKAVKVNESRAMGMEHQRKDKFVVSRDGSLVAFQGRYGLIHLHSAKSFEWLHSFKMNDEVSSIAFSANSNVLYSHGAEGMVYIWDVKSRRCLHKFVDSGCVKGTSIDVSENSAFLATGSNSGIVNIYDAQVLAKNSEANPVPLRVLKNLTTSIGYTAFNANTELFGFSSASKDNAFRMMHVNSSTVFKNLPDRTSDFGRVRCFDFSLNSGYLLTGNGAGRADLYRYDVETSR